MKLFVPDRVENRIWVAPWALLSAPANKRTRRWQDDLTREKDRLEFLKKYSELYGVYTEAEVIYTDERLLALHRSLPADRVEQHGFDAAEIDWEHYLQRVHCPAITVTVRRATSGRRGGAGSLPALKEAPNGGAVAVFDLESAAPEVDHDLANRLGEYLLARVAALPGYRVVPKEELRARLLTAKASSSRPCVDEACQIELGKALAAQKALAAKVLPAGGRCTLLAVLVDLRTETTERAATETAECSETALISALERIAAQLGAPESGTHQVHP